MSGIKAAQKAGEMKVRPPEITARVLNAALGELAVVLCDDQRPARLREAESIFRQMVEGRRERG